MNLSPPKGEGYIVQCVNALKAHIDMAHFQYDLVNQIRHLISRRCSSQPPWGGAEALKLTDHIALLF